MRWERIRSTRGEPPGGIERVRAFELHERPAGPSSYEPFSGEWTRLVQSSVRTHVPGQFRERLAGSVVQIRAVPGAPLCGGRVQRAVHTSAEAPCSSPRTPQHRTKAESLRCSTPRRFGGWGRSTQFHRRTESSPLGREQCERRTRGEHRCRGARPRMLQAPMSATTEGHPRTPASPGALQCPLPPTVRYPSWRGRYDQASADAMFESHDETRIGAAIRLSIAR